MITFRKIPNSHCEATQPNEEYTEILNNDLVIGDFRIYQRIKPQQWYIDRFFIEPKYRNQGLGSQALLKLIKYMMDIEKLEIEIVPSGLDIEKEKFIKWLVDRGFEELTITYKDPNFQKKICRYTPDP